MNSFLLALWAILEPIVLLTVTTIGPLIVAWLAAKVIAVLKVTDESKKLQIEQQLREAIHQSATNALAYAVSKSSAAVMLGSAAGAAINTGAGPTVLPEVLKEAVSYVREKNPDTVEKLGMGDQDIGDVILSKVPDLISVLSSSAR